MQIDFGDDDGQRVQDFITIPAGTYLCEIAEVRPGTTRNGDERWGLRLVVCEGDFVGRQAAWDGLSFSDRGRARVRRVLQAFGLPSSGRVDLEPDDLRGLRALVEVLPQESRDPVTGDLVRRNEVPYDGYRPVVDENGEPIAAVPGPNRTTTDGEEPPF
ncbi:MAG: hypothetical protein AAF196_18235 [Planctomycetota bacterium]